MKLGTPHIVGKLWPQKKRFHIALSIFPKIFKIQLNKSILNKNILTYTNEGDYLNNWVCQGNINISIDYKIPNNCKIKDKTDIIIEKLV